MPKKSGASKVNKSHKAHSPEQNRSKKPVRGERTNKKTGGYQKRNREKKPTGGNDNALDSIGKLTGVKKSKDGCLPKLFMLLLLFTAVGVYSIIKS
ncbi:MAG TPA: hypothetical protein VMN99_06025 [Anaerolineales bacterium]|nr:hypothetical protein [Anaerolineales bacterium]